MSVLLKCQYGNNLDELSPHERVLYVTQALESEVNNGGFSQFFYNSSGNIANELVAAFREIGAPKTALICEKALAPFSGSVPADRTQRQDLLETMEQWEPVWAACDDAFYDYEEPLTELNYAYIMAHRSSFPAKLAAWQRR